MSQQLKELPEAAAESSPSPLGDIVVTINQPLTTETRGQSGIGQDLSPLGSTDLVPRWQMLEGKQHAGSWLMYSRWFWEQAGRENCSAGAVDVQRQHQQMSEGFQLFPEPSSGGNPEKWLQCFGKALSNASHGSVPWLLAQPDLPSGMSSK